MKKIIFALAVLLLSHNANAAVRSIIDWDGGSNPYQSEDISITGENLKTKCSEACSGYDLKTTTCRSGEKIVHCSVSGCGYYNKCIAMSSEELKEQESDSLEDIDIDEIYNQIIKEQDAEQKRSNSMNNMRKNF